MRKKLLLIMNPYAGLKTGKRYLADMLELFCRAGYIPTVFMTTGPGDGNRLAAAYAAQNDLVVVCGGDGTFNETVSGILQAGADVPIGYIPCGSTNDFASSVKLPKSIPKAIRCILEKTPKPFDVGMFGDRYFSYVASFGAFTRASYATPQNAKNALGHLAYILEGIKDLPAIRPWRLRIETDKSIFEGEYIFGAISNSTSVGGILTLDPNTVDMNDGLFELLLIRNPRNAIELSECILALQEQSYDSPLLTFHSTSTLKIAADPDMEWSLDGEQEAGHREVTVKNLHSVIRLITP